MKTAYASVGLDVNQFLSGVNPTTQPGVKITYYATQHDALQNMEYIVDDKQAAACLMAFNVDETKLISSPNPSIVGRGTLQANNLTNAVICLRMHNSPLLDFIAVKSWDAARTELQERQKSALIRQGDNLLNTRDDGFSQFAMNLGQKYLSAVTESAQEYALSHNMELDEWAMRANAEQAWDEAYQNHEGPESEKVLAGLKAAFHYVTESLIVKDGGYPIASVAVLSPSAFLYNEISFDTDRHVPITVEEMQQQFAVCTMWADESTRRALMESFSAKLYELTSMPQYQDTLVGAAAGATTCAIEANMQAIQQGDPAVAKYMLEHSSAALIASLNAGIKVSDLSLETLMHDAPEHESPEAPTEEESQDAPGEPAEYGEYEGDYEEPGDL